ncbi:hypothetical protein L2089_00695 [Paenibacillus hunanensis]|uniref:stalk domain-containing protein n=1 Tax=Paenibacillus hunanensis TaxID=539262 RepID=UPI002026369F|nr:stalk domain-containing protein [Paenibacillus hunanensis]MCL9659188.1 hypothetical protein [Paenibacillus hunanensis]
MKWNKVILCMLVLISCVVPVSFSFASDNTHTGHKLSDIKQIASGYATMYALNKQGELWGWGYNSNGNLGLGDKVDRFAPVKLPTPSALKFKQIASGFGITAALTTDGQVVSWSNDVYDLPTYRSKTPAIVSGFSHIKQVATGDNFVLALDEQGKVWGWGSNNTGGIPGAAKGEVSQPVLISGLPDHIKSITSNYNGGGAALTDQGKVWYWRSTSKDGKQPATAPTEIPNISQVQSLHSYYWNVAVIDKQGKGLIFDTDSKKLQSITVSGSLKDISDGSVVTNDGNMYTYDTDNAKWISVKNHPSGIEQIQGDFLILTSLGEVWSKGVNVNGQLGIDSYVRHIETYQSVVQPIQVTVNGQIIQLVNSPKIINNIVYLPIRGVEKLGVKVQWNSAQKDTVILTKDQQAIQLKVGQKQAQVNGKTVKLDGSVQTFNGSILVPIRFVSQTFGSKVSWNPKEYIVAITSTAS